MSQETAGKGTGIQMLCGVIYMDFSEDCDPSIRKPPAEAKGETSRRHRKYVRLSKYRLTYLQTKSSAAWEEKTA